MKTQLIAMIDSCFTYGGAERDSYNFKRYIEPYKQKVKNFDRIYNRRLAELKANYTVKVGTYTDFEGLTYNSLVKK